MQKATPASPPPDTLAAASPGKAKLWIAAIKPPIYSVAVIPITVGSAIAIPQGFPFKADILGLFLSAAIAIIAWLNLSNDVFDSETGIDVNKAHSVVNLTGNKSLIFWISNAFLLLGLSGILAISWLQQDATVVLLILLACALGYTYQGPPFRLGYQGLGEIICFFTFGPLAIAAANYSQSQQWSSITWVVAVLIGLSTAIILFCSHFHQVEDDLAAGKRSPIVRLGTALGAKVLAVATASFFVGLILAMVLGILPLTAALALLSAPFGYQLIRHVQRYHDQPAQVSNCKFIAVNFHFSSGLLLALGLWLSPLLAS